MFKKSKTRPQNHRKQESPPLQDPESLTSDQAPETSDGAAQPINLDDVLALRNLRKAKKGIDATKLAMGEQKKRKRQEESEETVKYGLQRSTDDGNNDLSLDDEGAKARRTVRKNNFTQQTNALDVDKHMMAYIEENLKLRRGELAETSNQGDKASQGDGMLKFEDKFKTHNANMKEGSVTTSLAMLSAIPEVDLGMDARLRNIEETEKAKRAAAEERREKGPAKQDADEARLAATRFYNPHLRQESDDKILKNAKLQATGLKPVESNQKQSDYDKPQFATDEAVMERFRKRMRR